MSFFQWLFSNSARYKHPYTPYPKGHKANCPWYHSGYDGNIQKCPTFLAIFNSVKQLTNVNGKYSPHSEKTKVPLSRCERGSFTFQKWLFCTLKEALLKHPFQTFDYQRVIRVVFVGFLSFQMLKKLFNISHSFTFIHKMFHGNFS